MSFDLLNIDSPANSRAIPCAVVMPDETPRRVVYFYHGISRLPHTLDSVAAIYEDRAGLERIAAFFECAIVAPFLGQTFGIDSEFDPSIRMATFLTEELPSAAESRIGASFDRTNRVLAGFSMGGYAAINAICRAPDTFSVAVVTGAVTDPAHGIHDLHWDTAGVAEQAFGPYWENQRRYHVNSPFTLINRIASRRDLALGIHIGTDDFLLPTSRRFRERVQQTGIIHSYMEEPLGHRCGTLETATLLNTAANLRVRLFGGD